MRHDILPRHAKIAWLVMERFSDASAKDILSGHHPGLSTKANISGPFYRRELEQLSDEVLDFRYNQRFQARVAEYNADQDRIEERLAINTPAAFVDHRFWARKAYWSVEEAVSLSMNRDPDVVNITSLLSDEDTKRSRFAREFFARLDICDRAVAANLLSEPVEPRIFVAWLGRVALACPDDMIASLNELGLVITDWKVEYDLAARDRDALYLRARELEMALDDLQKQSIEKERRFWQSISALEQELDRLQSEAAEHEAKLDKEEAISPKLRKSLEVMLIAIAKEKFHYNPVDKKSSAPKNICDCVERAGLSIDRGTVLERLRDAAKHLPDNSET